MLFVFCCCPHKSKQVAIVVFLFEWLMMVAKVGNKLKKGLECTYWKVDCFKSLGYTTNT